MSKMNRRNFLKAGAATGAVLAAPAIAHADGHGGKVVIVGGGVAGATTARYLKLGNAKMDVTLIEPKASYHTCFMSNEVLEGSRKLSQIEQSYDGLKSMGVKVVKDSVKSIDAKGKKVMTAGGSTFGYDRCVVAPGIDFKVDGFADVGDFSMVTHAWKAGPQTATLRKQLEAIATEASKGIATVSPRDLSTCRYCIVSAACRIAERQHVLDNEDDETADE